MNMYTQATTIIRLATIIVIGFPFLEIMRRLARTNIGKTINPHIGLIISKIIFYVGSAFLCTMILHELGFELTALLGAAGIAGIALGFAAQTVIANLISGIFLFTERSFSVGDTINYQFITGIVESIDLLSTKIKTISGKRIRIPNELFIKEVSTNTTYHAQRRLSFSLVVSKSISSDIDIKRIMHETFSTFDNILQSPKPIIYLEKISYTGTYYLIHLWVPTSRVSRGIITCTEQLATTCLKNNIPINSLQCIAE